jgi:hypothetical protein
MENTKTKDKLLAKVAADFIGLDTVYTLANGKKSQRIYLGFYCIHINDGCRS